MNMWFSIISEKSNTGIPSTKVIMSNYPLTVWQEFKTFGEFKLFIDKLGVDFEILSTFEDGRKEGIITTAIDDNSNYFSSLDDLPESAKCNKIILIDNGDPVTCYFEKKNGILKIYRPSYFDIELRKNPLERKKELR